MSTDLAALTAPLVEWLPRQRWFAGKGRPITRVGADLTERHLLAAGAELVECLLTVDYTDGGRDHYQVPLTLRSQPVDRLEGARIGESAGLTMYDAPHDPDATAYWLDQLRAGSPGYTFTASAESAAGEDPLEGQVIGAEQSNTSVVYGSSLIYKLFRRLWPGENPDLEVTRALQATDCPHVIPPLGWHSCNLEGEWTTLGLLQPFYPSATEGWRMATASVRDLFGEEDLHAAEVGGDFAAEAARLGAATGEVHVALATVLPVRVADAEYPRELAERMQVRLAEALPQVAELAELAPGLREAFAAAAQHTGPITIQRLHGDLHLGQVLRTGSGWKLFDFEGEPARPLAERRVADTPLRDVAGMLRSFDYAAQSLLADHPGSDNLAYRAAEWAQRNREAFCDGYAAVTGADPREEGELVRALELEKAVYEAVYETRHRPGWLSIPLSSIARLVR